MDGEIEVLILSNDALLRELMGELLAHERIRATEAATLADATACCGERRPNVILIDAVEDAALATQLLDDPWTALGEVQPALVLLSGSTTADEITKHAYIDRVLAAPLQAEVLVQALRYHASGRARRQMRSGVQLRATVAQTFATKRGVSSG